MNKETDILRKQVISTEPDGTIIDGYGFVRGYNVSPTKTGGTYINGSVECVGGVQFKVWSSDPAYTMLTSDDFTNTICKIHAQVNDYGGQRSLIIKEISKYDGTDADESDFLYSKYDINDLATRLNNIINKYCSREASQVYVEVMTPIWDRFTKEFAASFHHDSCVNGLLAHTEKVTAMAKVINNYPTLMQAIDPDVLFVGCCLHDIGKVLEYNNGVVTNLGKIMSHPTIGIFMLAQHKDRIVELKGEDYYNKLVSIIQQHHAEFGERPRTLAAYIVSILDSTEAKLTDIQEQVEQSTTNQIKITDIGTVSW